MLIQSAFNVVRIADICSAIFQALEHVNAIHVLLRAGRPAYGWSEPRIYYSGSPSLLAGANLAHFAWQNERVRGIEPLSSAWKAEVMPLYDTRVCLRHTQKTLSWQRQ